MFKRLHLLAIVLLTFSTQSAIAQCCCATNLGAITPNMNWQFFQHSCLGYVSFPAQAGCTYQFTYCTSIAPSASYNGDPYLTINSSAMSGAMAANDDWCGLGSYIQWTAPSTQTYYLQLGNWAQGASCACNVNRNLGYRSTNCAAVVQPPTSITASAASICAGQSTTLTANGTMGTQNWYTGSCGGTLIGSGASITVSPAATTTYYVNNNSNGQASQSCASITITVNPSPPAPTVTGNISLCGPGTTTLTASGGQNNSYVWYSNANGTGQLSANASFTTPVLQTTTTYYVQTATVQGGSQNFPFTGGVQNFTAPINGVYTIEAWGAKGGDDGNIGANGGYATGTVALTAGQTLTVYTGGLGSTCVAGGGGGWNGGGNAGPAGCSGGGGGASDVRLGGNGLANRIIVAGGGGGAGCCGQQAGAGGGLNGNNGSSNGGSQVAGGAGNAAGSLGQGGNKNGDGGGGGGGYYGGGAAFNDDGGGGGSSYLGGVLGGNTIAGNASMPNPNGGNMTGNAGNGYVRITWSGVSCASALTPVTVTINPVPVVTTNNATVCAGQQTTLTATSTVPGGTFTWSPGNLNGASINVTPNATTTYTVTYTTAGCPPVTANAIVTVNPLQPITGTLTACLGLTSQLANVVTPGSWSSSNVGVATISNNGLVSAVSPGTSTITYNAGNGCSTTAQFTVFPKPVLTVTPNNVLCFGGNGSVTLSAAGASAPYTYGGAATQNLSPGSYTYTAISNDGCISQPVTITITQPAAALALSSTQVNVLCNGNNTGSVNLTVTGGTAPYTYAWSNNTTLEDPAGLAAGTYTVTVTDASGCTANTTVTITQPSTLTSSYTQVNVGCFGNNTGSINLTVIGGVAPYVYAWSNQSITEDLNNIPSGVYTVTATDANGCTTTQTVTITQPAAALALTTTQVNVLCFGNSTGSVNLTVSGGTAPYTYLWSNNGTVEDPSGMAAGSYTVTVTDANGCTANSSVTITQPAAGLALSTTQVNVLCSGNNTGSVNLTVTGGTAPYTYAWSNNTTLEDPAGLAAGTYTVTVTDASGCTANTTVTITQPSTLTSSYTQVNVGCFGNNTGSINLTVIGGVAPYVYAWSNQSITEDLNNIPSGVYTVTATDANGCTTTQTVTITQPAAALALTTTQVNVLCFGNSTGSVNLTVSGGTAPYTYLWSNNGTVEDPSGMAAGPYTVTVTDANGCTANSNVTITQPAAGLALTTTQVNVLCNGNNTGSVNLTVTGGTAPYTYAWSNNTSLQDPTGLSAGSYTVTVTDASGCTATTTVTITQPATPLSVTVAAQNILCLNGTGSVNSTPAGGVAPYTYSWSNQGITQNITNLQAGSYTVTVQDANGCTANATGSVVSSLSVLPVQILNLTGTTVLTCTTPAITLQATGGVTYAWTGGATPSNNINVINTPGNYTVNMVDPNGCPVSQTITLTQNITLPTPGITNVTGTTIIDCNAPSIDLQATGGGTYQWNNNLGTSANVNITQAGTYNVVVTAANGCVDSANVVITVAPVPAVTNIDTTICSGQSVVLTPVYYPAGGQSIWTNGQTTANITVNPNATTVYSVLYTWNGCVATGDMTVTVNPTPTLTANNANICFGDTALLTATPSLPNGTFNWLTTNQNTQNISVNPQITSSYNVTYTLNGCTSPQATSTVTVTPLPIITVQDITICEGQTGVLSANVNVPGGTYSWSQGDTTSSISESPITNTTYIVDYVVNGCVSNTETATINVNPLPIVSFIADTTTGCVPVTINLLADTTGQQATYSWTSNGAGSQVGANAQMTFSNGGCYDVTLTATMNGCPNASTMSNYICVQNYPQASFSPNPPAFTEASQTINFTNNTLGATGYVWNFGDGSLSNEEYPSHLFQGTNDGFTITLIASTSMGCMDSVSVEMTADIGAVYYIPNTFTPDGDKYNQTFKPVLSTGVSSEGYEMLIFNRWGEIMFESHNLNVGWDGSYGVDGLDCAAGTYTYKITFKLTTAEDKRIITGHVNLIR